MFSTLALMSDGETCDENIFDTSAVIRHLNNCF